MNDEETVYELGLPIHDTFDEEENFKFFLAWKFQMQ